MHPGHAAAQEMVHRLAADLRRGRVLPWPDRLDLPASVCAMVEMTEDSMARIYRNPRHVCANEQDLFVVAASLVLSYAATGPDDCWMAPHDGFGHTSLLSDTVWDALLDPDAVIPLSRMPRLA